MFYYTYWHFTSSHLHFTTLSFGLTHLHFLSFYYTSHCYTRHSTVLISKLISKIMNPFTALGTSHHFTSLFIFYLFIFSLVLSTLNFTLLFISTAHFPSLHFPSLLTFYRLHFPSLVFTFLTLILTWEVPITPSGSLFQSVMVLFRKKCFPMSVLCFLSLIFQHWSTLLK